MENNDLNLSIKGNVLNVRAAILVFNKEKDKFLVQKRKHDLVWALPGGKIKFFETSKQAIKRELEEELKLKISDCNFLSITENFFKFKDEMIHQYIFIYSYILDKAIFENKEEFDSAEIGKDVIYRWININDIDKFKIRPDNIKNLLENFNKSKIEIFSNNEI